MTGHNKVIVGLGVALISIVSCLGMVGMYKNFGWYGVLGLALMIVIMIGFGYVSDYRKKPVPKRSGTLPKNPC
jgi:hypothetical protein